MVLVAARGHNGVIGAAGGIPWRVPEDFAHFKALTMGHALVMGRTTYEAIGRPLPDRQTIVLTRDPDWASDGVLVAHSVDEAIELAAHLDGDVMVAGGAQVYGAALAWRPSQVLTEVHLAPEGDTHYPDVRQGGVARDPPRGPHRPRPGVRDQVAGAAVTDGSPIPRRLVATLVGHAVVVQRDSGRPRLPRRGSDPRWQESFPAATGDARAMPVSPTRLVGDLVLHVFSAAPAGGHSLLDLDDLELLAEDAGVVDAVRGEVHGLAGPPPLRPAWYAGPFLARSSTGSTGSSAG